MDVGGTFGADNYELLQDLVDQYPGRKIVIPSGGTIYTSRPLIPTTNTKVQVNGTLKLTDGVIRPLTQDAAIGQNRVYVDNSDESFKVGQWASVGATNYPTGGGGSIHRKMAQAGKIITATATYVEFEFNLRANLSGVAVGDLLVANGATIGHCQTIFYCRDINNITITGHGTIDGNYSTMHNSYHPCAMGGNTSSVAGYETSMGGNGIVFWNCDNITVKGTSSAERLTLQDFNIGGILGIEVDTYNFSNLTINRPYMKGVAFSLGADRGLCEYITIDTSLNEDGFSLHDLGTNSIFSDISISNCPRIGLAVGAGSHDNVFNRITITSCNLSLYSYIGPSDIDVYNNTFNAVTITDGIAGVVLGGVQNTVFNNLNISFGRAGNHCITVGGQCHDIIFNGVGCYDTNLISSNSGWGFRTVAKESYHDYESYNITVNDFEFKRLNRGVVDLGSFPVTFNRVVLDDNDLNGDITSTDFTFVSCTVDGNPYP